MYATDFLFNGRRASDFGLMICSFNGEPETVTGGELEYNTAKSPQTDRFTFYGYQLNSVLAWNFSICKNPDQNTNLYFNQYEESRILKWLIRTDGYNYIQFNQPGYEDIFYKVCINAVPHQISGRTAGFDLTVTSDCAYGFSDIIRRAGGINASTPLKLHIQSDINTYILPELNLKSQGNDGFFIHNFKDEQLQLPILSKPIEFYHASKEITMDSDTEIITGLSNPNDFNWQFLRLTDGMNFITTDSVSNIEIEIRYREPRFVRI